MDNQPVTNREIAQIARLIDPPLCKGWTYEAIFPPKLSLEPGTVSYSEVQLEPKWITKPRGYWRD